MCRFLDRTFLILDPASIYHIQRVCETLLYGVCWTCMEIPKTARLSGRLKLFENPQKDKAEKELTVGTMMKLCG